MAGWLDALLAPAKFMNAQPPDMKRLGLLGEIAAATDPVQAFGGYGNMMAMALPPGKVNMPPGATPMKLFQGRSIHNRGSAFYTGDKEFARQFTQSGLDKEISTASIDPKKVYKPDKPVYAGDMDAVDAAVAAARKGGFKAVELSEAKGVPPGEGEPASYFVFDPSAFKKPKGK